MSKKGKGGGNVGIGKQTGGDKPKPNNEKQGIASSLLLSHASGIHTSLLTILLVLTLCSREGDKKQGTEGAVAKSSGKQAKAPTNNDNAPKKA